MAGKTKTKRAKSAALPPGNYVLQIERVRGKGDVVALVGRVVGGPHDGKKVVFSS